MNNDITIPTTAPTSQLRRSARQGRQGQLRLHPDHHRLHTTLALSLRQTKVRTSHFGSRWPYHLFYCVCLVSIPQSYYELRPFEVDGRFYRRLGVHKFRYLVVDGDGIQRLMQRIDPHWQCGLTKLSNEEWIERTRGTEWIKLALMGSTLDHRLAYSRGRPILLSLILLWNIPSSVYPILLQRYTREKLIRIAQLRNKRSTSKSDLVSAATA